MPPLVSVETHSSSMTLQCYLWICLKHACSQGKTAFPRKSWISSHYFYATICTTPAKYLTTVSQRIQRGPCMNHPAGAHCTLNFRLLKKSRSHFILMSIDDSYEFAKIIRCALLQSIQYFIFVTLATLAITFFIPSSWSGHHQIQKVTLKCDCEHPLSCS